MIKIIKWISLGILGITFYTFAGVMTYRYHEVFYPGGSTNNSNSNASELIGLFWPIGLPATIGIHAARLIK